MRPTTPPNQSHNDHEAELPPAKRRKLNSTFQQYETPQKAQLYMIVAWEDSKPFSERASYDEIFTYCDIGKTQAHAILKNGPNNVRWYANNPVVAEARRSKKLLLDKDIDKLERLI